jgi:hypothetical protein
MSNPQQPELARSRKTPAQDQDSVASVLEGQREPATDGPRGPVPPENQPGHHPPKEQDEPDLDAFAERLGIEESADAAREAAVQTVAAAPYRDTATAPRSRLPRVAAVSTVVLVVGVVVTRRRRGRRARRS